MGPSRFDHMKPALWKYAEFSNARRNYESPLPPWRPWMYLEGLREELRMLQQQAASTSSTTIGSNLESQPVLLISGKEFDIGQGPGPRGEEETRLFFARIGKVRRLIRSRENALKWVKDSLDDLRKSDQKLLLDHLTCMST